MIKKCRKSKNRFGISSILGTIIVIAITVALGGLLYTYSKGLFQSMSQNSLYEASAQIVVNPDSNVALLEYSIQNTGNTQFYLQKIVILSTSSGSQSSSNVSVKITPQVIQPGQTTENVTTIVGNVTAGNYYTVIFYITMPNGKTLTSTENVLATIS